MPEQQGSQDSRAGCRGFTMFTESVLAVVVAVAVGGASLLEACAPAYLQHAHFAHRSAPALGRHTVSLAHCASAQPGQSCTSQRRHPSLLRQASYTERAARPAERWVLLVRGGSVGSAQFMELVAHWQVVHSMPVDNGRLIRVLSAIALVRWHVFLSAAGRVPHQRRSFAAACLLISHPPL
jgi:hypothetical protein